MIRQLDNSDFSIGVHSSDLKSPSADFISIFQIQAVIAAKFLNDFFFPIHPVGKCVWRDFDRLHLANKRAVEFVDHQI